MVSRVDHKILLCPAKIRSPGARSSPHRMGILIPPAPGTVYQRRGTRANTGMACWLSACTSVAGPSMIAPAAWPGGRQRRHLPQHSDRPATTTITAPVAPGRSLCGTRSIRLGLHREPSLQEIIPLSIRCPSPDGLMER
jgi:hypothetical protein